MTSERVSPEFLALQSAVVGRYSLVRELGRGGMGVVFLAREVALDRLVAIKLLPAALADDPRLRERFLREARTAAQLSHPHIVAIHAVEATPHAVFFVMEYVAGETLGARLRRAGVLPSGEALRIAREVAWALSHAHARGVVHRDVKPDNILLEEGTDRAIVTDFGIAGAGGGDTPVGVGVGTFHYMSPEQAEGGGADARADVYALGVTTYYAITGRRPFEGYEGVALLTQQAHQAAPSMATLAPMLPPAVAAAIDRAIAADPAARWESIDAFGDALRAQQALAPAMPVVLRRFARSAQEHGERLGLMLGTAATAGLSAAIVELFYDSFLGFDTLFFMLLALVAGGASLAQLASHIIDVRRVAALGYRRAAALRALDELEREERTIPVPASNGWSRRPALVFGLGVGAMLLGVYGTVHAGSTVVGVPAFLLAAIAAPVAVARALSLREHGRSWWSRLLRSRPGAMLWKVATLGQGRIAEAPAHGEPTALALGQAVSDVFAQLPPSQREFLGDVPALIERLEAIALEPSRADRIEAIAALETLRLDLLRLRAGELAADGITQDLERLRHVGRQVDAVLELRIDAPTGVTPLP